LGDKDGVWYEYIADLWRDIDPGVLKATFLNFGLNAGLFGTPKQNANAEKYGCNIPMAMLIDPTSACNLKCTGCWAPSLEALQSPLFMAYHEGQPFNGNHLLSLNCPAQKRRSGAARKKF
jgi:hypothetical protein